MVTHTTLLETEDQLVSRFIGGLRQQLQVPLQQFNPLTVSEAHQWAIGMELQYRSNWGYSTSRSRSQAALPQESNSSEHVDSSSS